jgi:hypothetical protein
MQFALTLTLSLQLGIIDFECANAHAGFRHNALRRSLKCGTTSKAAHISAWYNSRKVASQKMRFLCAASRLVGEKLTVAHQLARVAVFQP